MSMTLWELYCDAYDCNTNGVQWRVFCGRKKVCDDYGEMAGELDIDDAEVLKAEVKYSKSGERFVRVSLKKPCRNLLTAG